MMKKLLLAILLCLALVGCNSADDNEAAETTGTTETTDATEETSDLSMDTFIEAFEGEGIEVDPEEKPAYSMIGAIDGIIFYNGNEPVKIYEYQSQEAMDEAEEGFPNLADWDKNGLFVIETNDQDAKDIFNNVE
ncbi:hypothetical protein [Bacillus badius]|uniref:Lipoprotein n=1 Tax=Bacillus badius TaxID=1455 RepID=A0ABR5AXX5_BACBA|nr:hypothetical protein [Bacillus badius]KIL79594.1 hypothetical protein SD77_2048 [Bacillus badius]MED4716289.1 hypothetical protein [Bacillus badius]UAT29408.1 hypothetical protein K7T73_12435 [Bacillus badius]